ncbi:MAG: glycosyltransferase family 4 protein [Euryarchaeota archaeon]|nr:glycosyltransferase family 4 protein [Euryarchaeota archaeon]
MFTDTYLPTRDGVVTSILLIKKKLEEFGHEVVLFAPEPEDPKDKEEGVYYFRAVNYRRYPGYRVTMFPSNKCQILRDLEVDVIHTHGLLFMALRSMFTGRMLKKPVVVSFHTMITEASKYYARLPLPDEMLTRLFWIYLRQLLERADAVVVPSEAIKAELSAYAPEMRRIEVIPTGVDCSRFNPSLDGSSVRRKYGLDGERVVLHLGRIAWEKNLDLVLKAFSILAEKRSEVRLMVVGDGPARPHYVEVAEELGIADRTIFTGFVPDEELPGYYAASDAFAIASKFETQGLVVLEAMACGKPVAGINYRATAEILGDGRTGFLFDEDPESCARAMEAALDCPPEMRELARRKAEEYSLTENAIRLIAIYEYAIEGKRRRLSEG